MKITELAKQLGISRQVLHRHIIRGCPSDSLDSAIEWRDRNLDFTQTKGWRIDGNSGVKSHSCKPTQVTENLTEQDRVYTVEEIKLIEETLTRIVPELWFSQIGRLGRALLHSGVNVPIEKLVEVQNALFLMWMIDVDEYLQDECQYEIPFSLSIKPEDDAYPSLIDSLTKILSK